MTTETVAKWMIDRGYATGHGDTIEDLLKELEWQIRESEREACAKVCDEWVKDHAKTDNCTYADCDFVAAATDCAKAIRARGNI
jgi:hypothetical protein